jgi:hypothetical protein
MKQEPFEHRTIVSKEGKIFDTFSKNYMFDNKAERDYFAASQKDCFHKTLWQHVTGEKGNRKTEYHVTIHRLRNEEENS